MRFTLRTKLALLSLLLLFIPVTGLRFSALIKKDLLTSRQETLLFSARAVATALAGRTGLFDQELFHSLNPSKDLYLYPLSTPIRLNGKSDDWTSRLEEAQWFGKEHLLGSHEDYSEKSLSYRHVSGVQGKYLYGLFEVTDESVVLWPANSYRPDRSDHLQIGIEDREGLHHSYLIAAHKPGWVNGYERVEGGGYHLDTRIQGVWRQTKAGYTLELRLPMDMVGPRFAFEIADVDNPQKPEIRFLIGTARSGDGARLGWLLSPSDTITNILKSLNRPDSRIIVVDSSSRIRASYGDIHQPGLQNNEAIEKIREKRADQSLTSMDSDAVRAALAGQESVASHIQGQENRQVMAAAVPLKEEDEIVGAVVVEQSTEAILSLQNRVVEESLTYTLIAFCLGGGGLTWYAFRLSARIRKLGNQAEQAIGKTGRIQETISPATAGDEIGNLARILRSMLHQLKNQAEYRERMADTLEHEMRTPLAGIGAALKNMDREMEELPHHLREYLSCARTDIERLETMLGSVRDATSLKQALEQDYKEEFPLDEAISMWLTHGWSLSFTDHEILFQAPDHPVTFYGDPSRIRQLLDKLVENAVSFALPETPITIQLEQRNKTILISVSNQGPLIPEEARRQIFQSMVSLRKQKGDSPHLGLGLYIVRTIAEQYGGSVSVTSTPLSDLCADTSFTVKLGRTATRA